MYRKSLTLLLSLLSLLPSECVSVSHAPVAGQSLKIGEHQLLLHSFEGVPRWQLIPHLWESSWVNITCQGLQVAEVYTSRTWHTLVNRIQEDRRASCGWRRLLRIRHDSCQTPVSPFGKAYVAVKTPSASKPPRGYKCGFQLEKDFSYVLLGMTVAGGLLFLFSTQLSTSQPFRLSAGTLGFMALSFAIILVFLSRQLPSKKSMAVAFGVFGTSLAAVMQNLFGRWIPSYHQLIYSPWVLGYLVVTGLLGLALTYYYDDVNNHKLQTILRVALQLAGLGLVAVSTTLPEASAGICCLLILLRLTPALLPLWPSASEERGQGQTMQHAATLGLAANGQAEQARRPAQPAASEAASETESSDLEPASSGPSSGLGLQLCRIQQQRAEQLQSEASGPEARARLRKSFPAGHHGQAREESRHPSGGSSRHAEGKRRSHWFGLPRHSSDEEPRPAASQSPALRRHTSMGTQDITGSDVTSSHLNTSGLAEGSQSRARHDPDTPPHRAGRGGADLQQPVSPLVQKGYVVNTRTGKVINMERSTYTKLVEEGYQLDRVQGTLTPPSRAGALQRPSHSQQEAGPSEQQQSGQSGPDLAHRRSHRRNL